MYADRKQQLSKQLNEEMTNAVLTACKDFKDQQDKIQSEVNSINSGGVITEYICPEWLDNLDVQDYSREQKLAFLELLKTDCFVVYTQVIK